MYGMEIRAGKNKSDKNSDEPIEIIRIVNGQLCETIKQFKYFGAIISQEDTQSKVHARIGVNNSCASDVKTNVWRDKNKSHNEYEITVCNCS